MVRRRVRCDRDVSESNTVYRRPLEGRTSWRTETTPTGSDLLAIATGYPDVAVGKAGTVVERPPRSPPNAEQSETPPEKGTPPVDPCTRLETELLGRLERAELEYLLRHVDCESPLLEGLETLTGGEAGSVLEGRLEGQQSPVVVLPVADAVGAAGGSVRNRRSACDCGHGESTLEDVLLERLVCE